MRKKPVLTLNLAFLITFPLVVLSQEKIDFTTLLRLKPKKTTVLELGTPSPNELAGFEFTRKGKLKDIKLGISTKSEVGRLFGNCADACRYNAKWNVVFHYFSETTTYTRESYAGEGHPTARRIYVPLPEHLGKLKSIRLTPRKGVLFDKVTFSGEFHEFVGMIVGHGFDGNNGLTLVNTYTDGYGLRYSIIEEDSCTRCKKKDLRQKGELLSIEYAIPTHLEEKMFIEQK